MPVKSWELEGKRKMGLEGELALACHLQLTFERPSHSPCLSHRAKLHRAAAPGTSPELVSGCDLWLRASKTGRKVI